MRVAPPVELTEEQERALQQWVRGRSLPARQVERARVILLAAAGKQNLEIAAEIGISNQKAARWRKRFLKMGLAGLEKDAPRPGRTPTITPAKVQEVVRKTTQEKPLQRDPLEHPHDGARRWASVRRACVASGTNMA